MKLKSSAIVGNFQHCNGEIDMSCSEGLEGMEVDNFVLSEGHGLSVLASGQLLNLFA